MNIVRKEVIVHYCQAHTRFAILIAVMSCLSGVRASAAVLMQANGSWKKCASVQGAAVTVATRDGDRRVPLDAIRWMVGDEHKRLRVAGEPMLLIGRLVDEAFPVLEAGKDGKPAKPLKISSRDVAFFFTAELEDAGRRSLTFIETDAQGVMVVLVGKGKKGHVSVIRSGWDASATLSDVSVDATPATLHVSFSIAEPGELQALKDRLGPERNVLRPGLTVEYFCQDGTMDLSTGLSAADLPARPGRVTKSLQTAASLVDLKCPRIIYVIGRSDAAYAGDRIRVKGTLSNVVMAH